MNDGDRVPCQKCGEQTILFRPFAGALHLQGICANCDHDWRVPAPLDRVDPRMLKPPRGNAKPI